METQNEPTAEDLKSSKKDVDEFKLHAILAYFGLLVLVPILSAKDSKFAQFHANQGLILLIVSIGVYTVGSFLPFIGWFIILPIGGIFCFVLAVMGIINAANGEMKELPIIGGYKIIK